jgi:hypothetical protein
MTMTRTTPTLIALALVALTLPLPAAEPIRRDVSAAIDATPINRVVIQIPYSHLTVQNGDPKTLDAYGYVTRTWKSSKQRDAAQAIVADTDVTIEVEGSTAYVRRNLGPNARSRKAKGNDTTWVLAVRVPRGTNVVAMQEKGTFTAKGDFASMDMKLSTGDIAVEVPKKNVGELIARTRYGLLEVHLGDRIIENEGFMPRKAHYFYEGGRNVLTAIVTRGNISLKLVD